MMNTFKILPGVLVGLLLLALAYWLLMPWTTAGAVSAIPEPTKGSAGPAKSAATGPASLVLTTDAVVLLVGEGQAVITATVRDEVGQPVAGVDVQFAGSLGSMFPITASTSTDGIVTSTFAAGAEPGQATVTVECGELMQTNSFQLDGPQGSNTLNLVVDVDELAPGEQTSIMVTVRDQAGRPLGGELITLFGSLGTVSPSSSVSDDSGRVTATFTAGSVPGQATLTVLAGSVSNSDFVNIKVQVLDNLVYLPLVLCDYQVNRPPFLPTNPIPPDHATGQSPNVDLNWTGGDPDGDAPSYNVYLWAAQGTALLPTCASITTPSCDPGTLDLETRYTWYVVATDVDGATVAGPTWTFTTTNSTANAPPDAPTDPTPPDGAEGQSVDVNLSWSGGDPDEDAVTYNVHMGTDNGTLELPVCADVVTPACDPGPLSPGTSHVWQVIARDEHGAETFGAIWTFTTTTAIITGWLEVGSGSATNSGISDNGSDSRYPVVTIASDGSPYVAWHDDSDGDSEIYVRRWNGSTWGEIGSGSSSGGGISDNSGNSEHPAVAVAADGALYIAWGDSSDGNSEIYVLLWNESEWQEVGTNSAGGDGISGNSGNSQHSSVAIAPDGTPYVVWRDNNSGDDEIYVRRWNGSAWEEVGTGSASGGGISDNSGNSWYPTVAIAPDGMPYVAWHDHSAGDAEIYVRRWNGSTWEEVGSGSASGGGISNSNANSWAPSMAIAPDGTPYVTWHDHSAGDAEIYVRRWNGSSWEQVGAGSASDGGISDNSADSKHPALSIAPDGTPYIAWHDQSSGNSQIYVRRWNESTWEEVGDNSANGGGISDTSGDSKYPAVAVSPHGVPCVVWQDNSEGDSEVYVRRWQ